MVPTAKQLGTRSTTFEELKYLLATINLLANKVQAAESVKQDSADLTKNQTPRTV